MMEYFFTSFICVVGSVCYSKKWDKNITSQIPSVHIILFCKSDKVLAYLLRFNVRKMFCVVVDSSKIQTLSSLKILLFYGLPYWCTCTTVKGDKVKMVQLGIITKNFVCLKMVGSDIYYHEIWFYVNEQGKKNSFCHSYI